MLSKPTRAPSIDPDYPTITEAKIPFIDNGNKKTHHSKKLNGSNKTIESLESSLKVVNNLNDSAHSDQFVGSSLSSTPSFFQKKGVYKQPKSIHSVHQNKIKSNPISEW